LSYARQGINLKPTKHLGRKVKVLEEKGKLNSRSIENIAVLRDREYSHGHEKSKSFELSM
jgi:hypothetical protein